MSDESTPVDGPPPELVTATESFDLTVGQTQTSHTYQLRSRPFPPSDLQVVGGSEVPSMDPHSGEGPSGPETIPRSQSVEPSDSSLAVEISSSPWYEEEVETTSHRIASPMDSSSSDYMPILLPVPVAMEFSVISHSVTEFAPESSEISPTIVTSTAPSAFSSLSGTATSDGSFLGQLPEREDLIPPSLHIFLQRLKLATSHLV